MAISLNYDFEKYPAIKLGFNDLDGDGVFDTLLFEWNQKTAIFISDDGKLPWDSFAEQSDWNSYFNSAFNVGKPNQNLWNDERLNWGSYTLMVDKDGCGRFDTQGDWCYRVFDINHDGAPEAEYYHLFPGEDWCPFSNKLHVNLDGERDMSYLDFENLTYFDEQRYGDGNKYFMNVHGSGFFVNSYSSYPVTSWEAPIAWYDFDFDGKTNMTMRVGDTKNNEIMCSGGIAQKNSRYSGLVSEFEIAYELNANTSEEKYHSLDMELSFYNYKNPTLDYTQYHDTIPFIKPLKNSEFLYGDMLDTRVSYERQYLPYLDGYKIGMEHKGWDGVFMIFDEDDDDCRWEEMFSNHEGEEDKDNFGWVVFSDRIGDRTEKDSDYKGEGKLYIGRFDGRIHLYHAEYCNWEIDYLALYKGSKDHANTNEGPEPPVGLIYPRVKYYDTTGNGFIDTIVYTTVEYQNEANSEKILKTIKLTDYIEESMIDVDSNFLFDPRVKTPLSNFKLENWDGNPLTKENFQNSPAKAGFDKVSQLYGVVCDSMWDNAQMLYQAASKYHLNQSENLDLALKLNYSKEELLALKELTVPKGYSRHLTAESRREKYHNGYWLREKVFEDIQKSDKLDSFTLEKYYYTGRYRELCDYITSIMEEQK